jgi:Na+/citrate or Na+/malate symporter
MSFLIDLLLSLHNIWRWVVLVLAIVAAVTAVIGWLGKRQWTERDRKIGSFTAMSVDIQLLLGALLYILGEYGIKGLSRGMEFVNANRDYRFFGLEHFFFMLIAVVLAHLGSILPKRVEESTKKYMRAAIPFTLMLLLILVGIPWWRPLLRVFGLTLP